MKNDILQHINQYQLPKAFAALDQVVPKDVTYNRLKQEYLSGHTDGDYIGRLKVYVQSLHLRQGPDGQPRQAQRILAQRTAAAPKGFLGREQELKDMARLLPEGRLMLVNGEGGIGKTTLAARYWEQHAKAYDYLAWYYCESGVMNAVRRLALPLGLDLSDMNDQDQRQALAQALHELPGKFLLVLDNANEAEEIRAFEQFSRDLPWQVMLTSRCTKGFDDYTYRITALPPEQARELFCRYYQEDSPEFDQLLDRFLKSIGYHTLCTEIFAKNLQEANPWGYNFASFLQHMESKGLYLGDNSFEIDTKYDGNVQRRAAKSDEILDILYDFGQLGEEETVILIQMSLLPSEAHSPILLLELLQTEDKVAFRQLLNQLQRKGWLFFEKKGYRLSPVVQKVVLQRHADRKWELGEPMVEWLYDKFYSADLADRPPLHELEEYLSPTLAILENLANDNNITAWLRIFLGDYYRGTAQAELAVQQIKIAIAYFSENDQRSLSASFNKLGNILLQRNEIKKAEDYFQQSLDIAQQLVLKNPQSEQLQRDLSVSFDQLGNVLSQRNEPEKAEDYFQQSFDIAQQLVLKNPQSEQSQRDLSVCLHKLGDILMQRNKPEKAEGYYQQSLDIAQQLVLKNPNSELLQRDLSVSFEKLGNILLQRDEAEKAEGYYQQSLDITQQLFLKNPQSEQLQRDLGISFAKTGAVAIAQDQLKKGLEQFQNYYNISLQLYQTNAKYTTNASNYAEATAILAILHKEQGDDSDYQSQLDIAKTIWQELYESTNETYYKKKLDLIDQYEQGSLEAKEVMRLLSLE